MNSAAEEEDQQDDAGWLAKGLSVRRRRDGCNYSLMEYVIAANRLYVRPTETRSDACGGDAPLYGDGFGDAVGRGVGMGSGSGAEWGKREQEKRK